MAAVLPYQHPPTAPSRPRFILVKNIPVKAGWNNQTVADKLTIHFQKKRHGGDGNVSATTFPKSGTELDQAVIEFEDHKTARSVLHHGRHRFNGQDLIVTEYFCQGLGNTETEIRAQTILQLSAKHDLQYAIAFIESTTGAKISDDEAYRVKGCWHQVAAVADRIENLLSCDLRTISPRSDAVAANGFTEPDNASIQSYESSSSQVETAEETLSGMTVQVDKSLQAFLNMVHPKRLSTIQKKYKVIIKDIEGNDIVIRPNEKAPSTDVAGARKAIVELHAKYSDVARMYIKLKEFPAVTTDDLETAIVAARRSHPRVLITKDPYQTHRNEILFLSTSKKDTEMAHSEFRACLGNGFRNKGVFSFPFPGTSLTISIVLGVISQEKVDAIIAEADPRNTEVEPFLSGGELLKWELKLAMESKTSKKFPGDVLFLSGGNGHLKCNKVVVIVDDVTSATSIDVKKTLANVFQQSQKKGIRSISVPLKYLGGQLSSREKREQVFESIFVYAKQMSGKQPDAALRNINVVLGNETEALDLVKDLRDRWIKNFTAGAAKEAEEEERCSICLEDLNHAGLALKTLPCKHVFHQCCVDKALHVSNKCPLCMTFFGQPEGNQPRSGKMYITRVQQPCSGYRCSTIVITYSFPSGVQEPEHPNPGHRYYGTERCAYLPDNPEGRELLLLLQKAFNARLTFTVGRSVTTGCDNVITWNDIHHKTSMHGGSSCFGYPDPGYFIRLKEELKSKGIQ